VVAGLLLTPLALLYASLGLPAVWWAWPLTGVQAALASAVLASYLPLPGAGLRLDVGCSPCAAVAGASVVGSLVMRQTDPWDAGIGVTAALLLTFGLVQRVRDTGTCVTRNAP
jgi:hypothetical protein